MLIVLNIYSVFLNSLNAFMIEINNQTYRNLHASEDLTRRIPSLSFLMQYLNISIDFSFYGKFLVYCSVNSVLSIVETPISFFVHTAERAKISSFNG